MHVFYIHKIYETHYTCPRKTTETHPAEVTKMLHKELGIQLPPCTEIGWLGNGLEQELKKRKNLSCVGTTYIQHVVQPQHSPKAGVIRLFAGEEVNQVMG